MVEMCEPRDQENWVWGVVFEAKAVVGVACVVCEDEKGRDFNMVTKKRRQISSSVCRKDHAESPVVVIVGGAEFDHAAYRSGNVSLPYFNLSVSHGLPFA